MGLSMASGEMRVFKGVKAHAPVSAKVYFPGRLGAPARVRLVTTFYPYLQLTPVRLRGTENRHKATQKSRAEVAFLKRPGAGHFGGLDVAKVPREMLHFASAFATECRDTNLLERLTRRNLIGSHPEAP
jgi:hypothetical protein